MKLKNLYSTVQEETITMPRWIIAPIALMPSFFPAEVRNSMMVPVSLILLASRPSWGNRQFMNRSEKFAEIFLDIFLCASFISNLYFALRLDYF